MVLNQQKRPLPAAPKGIANSEGFPNVGTFEGTVEEVDWRRLGGPYQMAPLWRPFRHKRWQYVFIATREIAAAFAIADLTYTANAFVVVVDLKKRRALVDRTFLSLPFLADVNNSPGRGFKARFDALGGKFRSYRAPGENQYEWAIDLRTLGGKIPGELRYRGQISVAGGPPALTVISPVDGGTVSLTQKWGALPTAGSLQAGDRSFSLEGGLGGLDYTHGFMARHTAWRWGFATGRLSDGTAIGLNLVEGFTDTSPLSNENALWMGSELIPLDRAKFSFDPSDPMKEWTVTTVDGAVDLRFQPFHVHRDERDYRIVRSRFHQPFGFFSGSIRVGRQRVEVKDLAGVTENQDVLW